MRPTDTSQALQHLERSGLINTELRKHQLQGVEFGLDHKRVVYWYDIGTGKTLMALALAAATRMRRTLVICPNPVIHTWLEEVEKHTGLTILPLVGEKAERDAALDQNVDVYVINYEGLKVLWAKKVEKKGRGVAKGGMKYAVDLLAIKREDFDCVVADEFHRFKEWSALQTKIGFELSKRASRTVMLTGSPTNGHYLDLWAEYMVLDQGGTLGDSWYRYVSDHFHVKKVLLSNFRMFPIYTLKEGAEDRILDCVEEVTVGCAIDECVDLPEKTYEKRLLTLPPKARKMYDDLMQKLKADTEEGKITIKNVEQRYLRLAQLLGGFVRNDQGEIERFKDWPKAKEVVSTVSEIPVTKKVIVFHNFVEEGRIIEDVLVKAKIEFASMRGEVENKGAEYDRFLNCKDVRVLVAHPLSAGEGLNFQGVSNFMIFYSNTFMSPISRSQCEGRIHRMGQKSRCLYVDLLFDNTADTRVLEALLSNLDVARGILACIQES